MLFRELGWIQEAHLSLKSLRTRPSVDWSKFPSRYLEKKPDFHFTSIFKIKNKNDRRENGPDSGFECLNRFSFSEDSGSSDQLAFSPDGEMLVYFNNLDQCSLVDVSLDLKKPSNTQIMMQIADCNLSSYNSAVW